jgi:hypothetical protein
MYQQPGAEPGQQEEPTGQQPGGEPPKDDVVEGEFEET